MELHDMNVNVDFDIVCIGVDLIWGLFIGFDDLGELDFHLSVEINLVHSPRFLC